MSIIILQCYNIYSTVTLLKGAFFMTLLFNIIYSADSILCTSVKICIQSIFTLNYIYFYFRKSIWILSHHFHTKCVLDTADCRKTVAFCEPLRFQKNKKEVKRTFIYYFEKRHNHNIVAFLQYNGSSLEKLKFTFILGVASCF